MSNIPLNRPIKRGYFYPSTDHRFIMTKIQEKGSAGQDNLMNITGLPHFRLVKMLLDLADHGLLEVEVPPETLEATYTLTDAGIKLLEEHNDGD